MKTTTQKTAPTKPNSKRAPKGGSGRAALPLRWTATEFAPRKRWWWFAGLVVVSLLLAGLALALQDWSLFALVIATALVFFVMYLPRPREWQYELTKRELHIGSGKKKLVFPLDEFRAFTVEELPLGKGVHPNIVIVLLPGARFRPAVDLYLTQDDQRDLVVAEALGGVLPYDEGLDRPSIGRATDRLARVLRLG